MKKGILALFSGIIVTAVVSLGGVAYAADTTGSAGALADTDYSVEEMLVYAVQDEYGAQAEYEAIVEAYGDQIPFTNILKAEANHIDRLKDLFTEYGYAVPDDKAEAVLPESLETAYTAGIAAENNNIAMYEKFLKEELPSDVEFVFSRLLRASQNHLTAFQNAEDGNLTSCTGLGGNGSGYGYRQSNAACTGSATGGCYGSGVRAAGMGRGRR